MKSQENETKTLRGNLHQLVGVAVDKALPAAVRKNSFIVNEIPRDFEIKMDGTILVKVLDGLLNLVTNNSKHSCIRIKAKEYEDIIFVSVKDNNSVSDYTVNGNLDEVKHLAKKINGSINIESVKDNATIILLSFPNFPKAA